MSLLKSCGGIPVAPTVDLTQGLVAHFLLNNNADDSHGTYDGSSFNGVDFQGDMAKTDGVDDYITMPLNTNLAPFNQTNFEVGLSFWFRTDAITNDKGICQWGDVLNDGTPIILLKYDASGRLNFYTQSVYTIVETSLTPNTMYHIFITRSDADDTWRIYLNGVLKATYTNANVSYAYGQKIFLGNGFGGYTNHSFSNMRVYNVYKNQTFVDALYAEGYYPKPLTLPKTEGLIAHYPLTGTAEDAHGAGGNESGTEYNGVAFVDESIFKGDKVAVFDGVDDYVDTGYYFNTSANGSISAWVNITAIPATNKYIVGSYDLDPNRIYVQIASTGKIAYGVGSLYKETTTDMPLNTFVNITIKFDGSTMYAYLNSVLIDTSSYTGLGVSTVPSFIGARNMNGGGVDGYISCQISNVRFYTALLAQADIDDIYAEGFDSTVVPTTTGLVAHYKFNGSATDETGTYNGTVYGSMAYSSEHRGDSVASFDGIDDYIGIPHSSVLSSNSQTFSIWIKTDYAGTDSKGIIYKAANTGVDIREIGVSLVSGGTIYASITDASASVVGIGSTVALNDNQWHHLVIIKEYGATNDTLYMYIDGTFDKSLVLSGHGYVSTNEIVIGKISSTSLATRYWDGYISTFEIYDRALTQTEITALYNEVNEPTDGLVAYYPLTKEARASDMWVAYDGVESGVTYVDDAEFGSVSYYNGANAGISFAGDTRFQGISVFSGCFWIKTTRTVASDLISQWSSTASNTVFEVQLEADGSIRTLFRDADGVTLYSNVSNATVVNDGNWHFVYFHFDGGECSLSIDFVNTADGTNVGAITRTTSLNLWFGRRADGTNDFVGNLKDIHFFNSTLTTQELTDIYNYEKNFRPIDIDDGLVAYYPLADNSLDNYKNQYDGVDTSITYDGLSSSFGGGTDRIQASGTALDALNGFSNSYTFTFWVKGDVALAGYRLLEKADYVGSIFNYSVSIQGGTSADISFAIYDGTNVAKVLIPKGNILDNTWHFIVFKVDNSTDKLSVSIDIGTPTEATNTTTSSTANTVPLNIGNNRNGDRGFVGNMSKLRIYGKATTPEQESIIYNTEKGDFGL